MLGIACISVLVMSRSRCSCSSRCLRSVTSTPLTRRSRRSSIDGQADARPRHRRAAARSSSPTCCRGRRRSRRRRPGRSAPAPRGLLRSDVVVPEHRAARLVRRRPRASARTPCSTPRGSRTPFSSIRQRRLGASFAIALRNARSRSRASASSWRAVMSIPPAMMPVVRPCSSGSGAERQKTTRRSPRRLTNVFSYSTAGCSGAAASNRAITSVALRLGSMKTSQNVAAADRLLVVLARRLDRGGVLVHDPCPRGRGGRRGSAPC